MDDKYKMPLIKRVFYWLELLGWRKRTEPFGRWLAAYNLLGMQEQWPCVVIPKYERKTDGACPYIIFADTGETADFIMDCCDGTKNDNWQTSKESSDESI